MKMVYGGILFGWKDHALFAVRVIVVGKLPVKYNVSGISGGSVHIWFQFITDDAWTIFIFIRDKYYRSIRVLQFEAHQHL